MPFVRLNDAELEHLRRCTCEAFRVYVEGLKPQMDYRTGLVGATFPTSKASIANRIGGRDAAEMLSADQVKRKLGELQKAGLIAPKSTTNSLILLLPKADFDVKNSRPAAAQQPPSKIAQQETQQAAQQEAGEKASEYKVQPPTQETEAAQQTTQQGDPPYIPGKTTEAAHNPYSVIRNSGSSEEREDSPRARDEHRKRIASFVGMLGSLQQIPGVTGCTPDAIRNEPEVMQVIERCVHAQANVDDVRRLLAARVAALRGAKTVRPVYFVPVLVDYLEGRSNAEQADKPPARGLQVGEGESRQHRNTERTPEDIRAQQVSEDDALRRQGAALGLHLLPDEGMPEYRLRVQQAERRAADANPDADRRRATGREHLQIIKATMAGGGGQRKKGTPEAGPAKGNGGAETL